MFHGRVGNHYPFKRVSPLLVLGVGGQQYEFGKRVCLNFFSELRKKSLQNLIPGETLEAEWQALS